MSIGVFLCDCKGQVGNRVDCDRVAAAAEALDGVAFVEARAVLCTDATLGAAVHTLRDQSCDRLLFAGCSPRSSLKFPEERVGRVMQGVGLLPELVEFANIREQCAWQHEDRDAATRKAIDLVRMAHARLVYDQAAPPAAPISKQALVVGGGPAGLQTAKDLAAAGVSVTLVERKTWLGGKLCQLPRIFQTEGWSSVCDSVCVGPVQAKGVVLESGIDARTGTEILEVERTGGNFRVRTRQAARFVDPELCIACDECTRVCPEETARAFDEGLSTRKAIDKEFERAVPDSYDIVESACTRCGDCVPVCPTAAIDLDAQPTEQTDEFGAVFIATGFDAIDLSGYPQYLDHHPNVVTGLEYERILAKGLERPSDGEVAEQVVFVQCAGSRAGPEKNISGVSYCSKTCCGVTAKQVDRTMAVNPMAEATVVTYRDMRTYERALEALHQHLVNIGIEFVNGDLAGIDGNGDGKLKVTVDPIPCFEDDEPAARTLEADLVVLAAAQTPAQGATDLCRAFRVPTDRFGYPIENQPRLFRPTESFVDRVFVVGSSCGPKVIQQACEQGSAAAMRALPALLSGEVRPSRYTSRIDPERCTRCRTCEAVCPHGAIRITGEGAVSDAAFCQACGFCAAACPVHAAELQNFTDRQILEQVRVAFGELPAGEPRLLALLCTWCSYSAADFAGIQRHEAIANYRAIRVRCSSSVNTGLLLKMFQLGVDGILVAGCPERSCHHLWGNYLSDKRIDLARALIGQLGLEPGRLRFEYIGAPMEAKLREVLATMDNKLRPLGRNPVAGGLD